MNRLFRIFSLLLAVIFLSLTIGCKDSYQEAYIYFELPEIPSTLDPQTADSDTELLIVKNIYEGLLRKNASGAIVCGVAESFSYNNNKYTFKLRDNAIWNNETPVTAKDFVFALRRAVTPATKSPFASRLFSIANAESIYSGRANPETLGVTAVDDTTLTIDLIREDPNFEQTLTTSVAMPCNEQFFNESSGKYGLSRDYIISNGSYRLTKWNKEVFGIRLYKNDDYTGTLKAKNAAVFLTCDNKETPLEKLIKNSIDLAFIDSSLSTKAEENKLKMINYENICWFMTIGPKFSNDMRKSLSMLIGSNVFGNDLKPGYSAATSIFPSSVGDGATSAGMTFYDLAAGRELFTREVAKLKDKKFPSSVKLYYYDNGAFKPVVTDIVGHWQNNLGAFVNIESVSSASLLTDQLIEQNYDMAVFPVRADNTNVAEYLQKFGIKYNGESLDSVQTDVLKSNSIIPIAFQNTTIAYTSALHDVFTEHGNGFIDFSFIIKTE